MFKYLNNVISPDITLVRKTIARDTVRELYNLGYSDTKIAKRLGFSRSGITQVRLSLGLKPLSQEITLPSKTKKINVSDLTYIAGLSDGEACFSLISRGNGAGFIPRIAVELTNYDLLFWLKIIVGTGIISKRPLRNKNAKPKHVFVLSTIKDVRDFLVQLLPFLKLKTEQAELLIEYCNIRLSNHKFVKQSPREMEIYNRMKILNRRGI